MILTVHLRHGHLIQHKQKKIIIDFLRIAIQNCILPNSFSSCFQEGILFGMQADAFGWHVNRSYSFIALWTSSLVAID